MEWIPPIKLEQDLQAFHSTIAHVVPAGIVIKHCSKAFSDVRGGRSVICVYVATFLVRVILSLLSLVLQVLRKIDVQPHRLSPDLWCVHGANAFLNHTLNIDLGLNKQFFICALQHVDDWFDLELRKGRVPLVKLPYHMEVGWQNDLLKVDYDSSTEKSYFDLPLQAGSIGTSLEPPPMGMLGVIYQTDFLAQHVTTPH